MRLFSRKQAFLIFMLLTLAIFFEELPGACLCLNWLYQLLNFEDTPPEPTTTFLQMHNLTCLSQKPGGTSAGGIYIDTTSQIRWLVKNHTAPSYNVWSKGIETTLLEYIGAQLLAFLVNITRFELIIANVTLILDFPRKNLLVASELLSEFTPFSNLYLTNHFIEASNDYTNELAQRTSLTIYTGDGDAHLNNIGISNAGVAMIDPSDSFQMLPISYQMIVISFLKDVGINLLSEELNTFKTLLLKHLKTITNIPITEITDFLEQSFKTIIVPIKNILPKLEIDELLQKTKQHIAMTHRRLKTMFHLDDLNTMLQLEDFDKAKVFINTVLENNIDFLHDPYLPFNITLDLPLIHYMNALKGWTFLHHLVVFNQIKSIKFLLDNGLNFICQKSSTEPFQVLAHTLISYAICLRHMEMARLLASNGAAITNQRTNYYALDGRFSMLDFYHHISSEVSDTCSHSTSTNGSFYEAQRQLIQAYPPNESSKTESHCAT